MKGFTPYPETGVCVSNGYPWSLELIKSDVRAMETAALMHSLRPRDPSPYLPEGDQIIHHPDVHIDSLRHGVSQIEQAAFAIKAAIEDEACLEIVSGGLHDYLGDRDSSQKNHSA